MTAKEYLWHIHDISSDIDSINAQIQQYSETAMRITASLDGISVKGGALNRREDSLLSLTDKVSQLSSKVSYMLKEMSEAQAIVDTIESASYRAIIRYKYFARCSWSQIAQRMRYSKSWVYSSHGAAVEAFASAYNKRKNK